jgi:phosphatidylglycerol lysyltransferase
MERVKSAALIRLVAFITLASGVANLFWVLDPLPLVRQRVVSKALPLEFFHFPRSFTLLIGFALVISALNVYRRKRRAFYLALALSSLSVVAHLLKGRDYEQALLSLVLIGLLWRARRAFTVRSGLPDRRWPLTHLAVAVSVAIGYGVAGFWLLDRREFGIDFTLADSLQRTLRYLTWANDPGLVPRTNYAAWFLASLYALSGAVIIYAGFAFFRPVLYRYRTLPRERALAKEIVERHGRSALDYFKLWPNKAYFFSASKSCFVAYSVGANCAIALGDPVGPTEEIAETISGFRQFCADNGWGAAFYQTLPDFLPMYRRLGFKKLKIGDAAIVDLHDFSLEGRAKKRLRSRINQLEKEGLRLNYYDAPLSDALLKQLHEVSNEWLRLPGRREHAFSLGRFEPAYLRSTPVAAVEDARGRVLAFVNIIPSYQPGEATIDLMRHRTDAPNGVMDYLFVKLLLRDRDAGYARFNFGMAPMSGFQEREEASAMEWAVYQFFQRLTFLFSFGGLKAYKAKFATRWEPRYMIYRHPLDLPKVGLALGEVAKLK